MTIEAGRSVGAVVTFSSFQLSVEKHSRTTSLSGDVREFRPEFGWRSRNVRTFWEGRFFL